MSVERFTQKLDIFAPDKDRYAWVTSTLLSLGAVVLLTVPSCTLKWDGDIGNPFDTKPTIASEATLNRFVRFGSAIAAFCLGVAALKTEFETKERTPTRKMQKETLKILTGELLNQQLVALLPDEEPDEQQPSHQENVMQQLAAYFQQAPSDASAENAERINELPAAMAHATTHQGFRRFDKFRDIGERILKTMTVSEKSILFASGTGTGKTTTQRYLIQQMIARSPGITFYALLQKNDSFEGVDENNTLIFQPELLDIYLDGEDGIRLSDILKPLYLVYSIFLKRKRLPLAERERLKVVEPVRLILDDWYATYNELQARLNKKDFEGVISTLRQIITVGRDMGVSLLVGTQSANLSALGFSDDASIRVSLDMYAQGFISHEDGQERGELKTMRFLFENPKICDKEERVQVFEAYKMLQEGIHQGEITSPIIFTTVGSFSALGIVPNLKNIILDARASSDDFLESEFEEMQEISGGERAES